MDDTSFWSNITTPVLIGAVIIITFTIIGFVPGLREDVFAAIGIKKEEKTNIETNENYVTIIGIGPKILNEDPKAIYANDPKNWNGVKNPKIDHTDIVILKFDNEIEEKMKECVVVWQSEQYFLPNEKKEWTKNNPVTVNYKNEKELKLTGFKDSGWVPFTDNYYYMIRFEDCFKSKYEKPINPHSAIVKFRTN